MASCGWRDCRALFHVCSRCDRGQRYCSSACAAAARAACLRAARRRHQRSPEGRADHRGRMHAYRARRRTGARRVTEQGVENLPGAASVAPVASEADTVSDVAVAAEQERGGELCSWV